MSTGRDRVLCVSLSEAEWEAFVARHPEPVDWLRNQILAQIPDASDRPSPQPAVRDKAPGPFSTRRV